MIRPHYPAGKRGRPPIDLKQMLRMCLFQIWFHLSDPATEDAIYDSYAMGKFTGINFMTESMPDETTLCKFRYEVLYWSGCSQHPYTDVSFWPVL